MSFYKYKCNNYFYKYLEIYEEYDNEYKRQNKDYKELIYCIRKIRSKVTLRHNIIYMLFMRQNSNDKHI